MVTHELPDGQTINFSSPRFAAPEALFTPGLVKEGDETLGMHQLCWQTIQETDVDIRRDLLTNVICSGGSTLYKGLPERVKHELQKLAPAGSEINIIAPEDRYYSVWTGGSTLTSLSTFGSQWITAEEYEENGTEIVHRKCQ